MANQSSGKFYFIADMCIDSYIGRSTFIYQLQRNLVIFTLAGLNYFTPFNIMLTSFFLHKCIHSIIRDQYM